jgi:hypothetical protein
MSARSFTLDKRRQGNITIDRLDDGGILVKLHGHIVVSIDAWRYTIRLDSCGYRTATTKTAINRALELYGITNRVYQSKGKWYLTDIGVKGIDFEDNMVLYFRDLSRVWVFKHE